MDIEEIKPIKSAKISEQVAGQLKDLILEGRIKPGQKVPSEESLAQHFGVGRRSVREGLQSLAVMGLVTIRQGEGTFVTGVDLDSYMLTMAEVLGRRFAGERNAIFQLMEVRYFLEVQVGVAAAKRAEESDLRRMEQCLRLQEEALDKQDIEAFNREDVEFHQAMVDAAKNEILAILYKTLTNLMFESLVKTNLARGVTKRPLIQHRDILSAIRQKSDKRIRETISHHLEEVRRNFRAVFGKNA